MIYVNATPLDLTNSKADYIFASIVTDYRETIKELRDRHGNSVIFMTPSYKPRLDKITKMLRPEKPYSWPLAARVIKDDGVQEWVYSASSAKVKDGEVIVQEPNLIISRGSISYSFDEDAELIYFLTKIRAFQKGKLFIHDAEKDEDKRAEEIMAGEKLRSMIYSEGSPLFNDLEVLKIMASKWGIANVDNKSTNTIRNLLFDTVSANEEQRKKGAPSSRGIKGFLEDCGGSESVKIGAEVQGAMDKGFLFHDKLSGEWKLQIPNGDVPVIIMTAGNVGGDVARTRLIDYLLRNKQDSELISKVLGGEVKVEHGQLMGKEKKETFIAPDDVNLDNLYEQTPDGKWVVPYTKLQKTLKALGSSKFGGTDDVLRQMVKEKLEELATT